MHNRLQATRMVAQLAGVPSPNPAPDKGAITPCPRIPCNMSRFGLPRGEHGGRILLIEFCQKNIYLAILFGKFQKSYYLKLEESAFHPLQSDNLDG